MKTFNSGIARVRNSDGKFVSLPALRGLDSYELAVNAGFEGTEEEWMNSIIGDGWIGACQQLESRQIEIENEQTSIVEKQTEIESSLVEIESKIENSKSHAVLTGTLSASGWVSGSNMYNYTLSLSGINVDPISITVDLNLNDVVNADSLTSLNEAWGCILKCNVSAENTLYFVSSELPTVDIPVKVDVVN